MNSRATKLEDQGRATDWRFTRLVVAIGLYAAAVGASAVLVSFIVRSTPWDWSDPGRLPAVQAIYFAGAGSVGAIIMSIPIIKQYGANQCNVLFSTIFISKSRQK